MAVPKQRRSKAKKRTRRSCWKLTMPNLVACGNCSALSYPHRACTECGFYKGRQVLQIKEKQPKKDS